MERFTDLPVQVLALLFTRVKLTGEQFCAIQVMVSITLLPQGGTPNAFTRSVSELAATSPAES